MPSKKRVHVLKKQRRKYKIQYEKDLNAEQLEVVKSTERISIVIAGAGTGKTRTLVYRVAWLIENGIPANQIMLVTFTNKAASEMVHRVDRLLEMEPKGLWGGTFHHIGVLLLRKYSAYLEIKGSFTILDAAESAQVFKKVAVPLRDAYLQKVGKRRLPSPRQMTSIYQKHTDCEMSVSDAVAEMYPGYGEDLSYIQPLINAYEEEKRAKNLLDFGDLLKKWLQLLQHKDVGHKICRMFRHVLVDEYQDVNSVQAAIVETIANYKPAQGQTGTHIMVVGDDAQSIYSFRGADIHNLLDFPKKFKECRIFYLTQNYRSTPEILNFSNKSIEHNEHQFKKELWTERPAGEAVLVCPTDNIEDQSDFLIEKILEFRDQGIPLNHMAVLFRATYHSNELQMALDQSNIPYEVRGGYRFFEKMHIKDVLSFLRIMSNAADELAWTRCLELIKKIGTASAVRIYEAIAKFEDPLHEVIQPSFITHLKGLRINLNSWKKFTGIIKVVLRKNFTKTSEIIDTFLKVFYIDYLKGSRMSNPEERLLEIKQLSLYSEGFATLEDFITHCMVDLKISGNTVIMGKQDSDEEELVLSTVHQAKGLEWQAIFIINVTHGGFPISRAIGNERQFEEERRLFYVACTRAEDYLHITYPIFGRVSFYGDDISKPSPFLTEIPEDCYEEMHIEPPPSEE